MSVRDSDLVVVIWANTSSENGRIFETITRNGGRFPVAWRFSYIQSKYSTLIFDSMLVSSDEELRSWMHKPVLRGSTRENPLIVPVSVVERVLGWSKFDVWDEKR